MRIDDDYDIDEEDRLPVWTKAGEEMLECNLQGADGKRSPGSLYCPGCGDGGSSKASGA